jgi:cephalosporin hydroxylase
MTGPIKRLIKAMLLAGSRRVFRWDVGPIFELFHESWYDARGWERLTWFGVPILKNPFDLLKYQDLLVRQRVDFVIESGANCGGSTLYFAHVLDALGHGAVISIDLHPNWAPAARAHPRVTTVAGSSIDPSVLGAVRSRIPSGSRCFVILDSDHHRDHVLAELRSYGDLVQVGDYLVVEDTNLNGHPVSAGPGPGPYEAVQEFLREDARFSADHDWEFPFTFAPGGWLKRVRA